MSRAFSAGVLLIHGTWGACPRLAMNAAPLALSKYADRIQGAAPGDRLAANCWFAQSHLEFRAVAGIVDAGAGT
ncbi:MAG TPA: hypothetical protein VK818_05565 [Methylomirabilota bacterium]|nr:hypothetical protein [Methylomirabilota bacterium]